MSDSSPPAPTGTSPEAPLTREPSFLSEVGELLFRPFAALLESLGAHVSLLGQSLAWLFRRPFRLRLFLDQAQFVGVGSLPIILLVGFFSGGVSALQALLALKRFQQERFVGMAVGLALAREIAPVFTSLMLTARAGSGMATELGSMRITEQIDALTTFAVNPVQYLITPRVVATIIMAPIMTMVFNVVGLFGAYVVAINGWNIDYGHVVEMFRYAVDPLDYMMGLIKAVVFGLTLSLAACFQGFFVRGGAKEVGRATTRAVVVGSVAVLLLDYFLTDIMAIIWPAGS